MVLKKSFNSLYLMILVNLISLFIELTFSLKPVFGCVAGIEEHLKVGDTIDDVLYELFNGCGQTVEMRGYRGDDDGDGKPLPPKIKGEKTHFILICSPNYMTENLTGGVRLYLANGVIFHVEEGFPEGYKDCKW